MSAILLAPHNDDETLFAAYTCLRHKPLVAVCYQSVIQERYGIYAADREAETADACAMLGCDFEQWESPDSHTSSLQLVHDIGEAAGRFDHCFAPAIENGGHDQHNLVGKLARESFGPGRVTFYLMYVRGRGRSRGMPVEREREWPAVKLRAMACYPSQINLDSTQPWFANDWIGEWYV